MASPGEVKRRLELAGKIAIQPGAVGRQRPGEVAGFL
jgi:hypothetical protein